MKKLIIGILIVLLMTGCGTKKQMDNIDQTKEEVAKLNMITYIDAIEESYAEAILTQENIYNKKIYKLIGERKIQSVDKEAVLIVNVKGIKPNLNKSGEISIDANGYVNYAELNFESFYVTYCNKNKILISKEAYLSC